MKILTKQRGFRMEDRAVGLVYAYEGMTLPAPGCICPEPPAPAEPRQPLAIGGGTTGGAASAQTGGSSATTTAAAPAADSPVAPAIGH